MTPEVVVLIGGTGVFPLLAELYYPRLRRATGAEIVCIPWAGSRTIAEGYAELESQLDRLIGSRTSAIIGHSQGGLMALLYAMGHPKVIKVVPISAPLRGTHVARVWPKWLPGCFGDMATDCLFSRKLVRELEAWLESNPATEIDCIYTTLDMVVWPTRSSYLPGAHNYLFVPPGLHWLVQRIVPSDIRCLPGIMNHYTEPWDPLFISLLGKLLRRPVYPPLRVVEGQPETYPEATAQVAS